MRNALTLIELIFSMVIIGIVFTVIPKLIISMNQSAQVTIKEEAMFNAVAMMGAIINLPWDNNNTVNNQILNVSNHNSYDCNASNTPQYYRKGGFVGGRNCSALTDGSFDFNASSIGNELNATGDKVYDDIDDYNATENNASNDCAKSHGKSLYSIRPIVIYSQDPDPTASTIQLPGDDKNLSVVQSSNTKRIIVKVGYSSDNSKFYDPTKLNCITALEYHSFNLGNAKINSRSW